MWLLGHPVFWKTDSIAPRSTAPRLAYGAVGLIFSLLMSTVIFIKYLIWKSCLRINIESHVYLIYLFTNVDMLRIVAFQLYFKVFFKDSV